jgi:hypothetical protein
MKPIRTFTSLLAGVAGVAASAAPIQALDVDKRYHALHVVYYSSGSVADPTSSAIDNIKVFVNGITMVDASATQLVKLAKLMGYTPGTGQCPILFSEPSRYDVGSSEASSYDLFGQDSFAIQITLNASASTPTCDIVSVWDKERNGRTVDGKFVPFLSPFSIKSITLSALASGDNDVTTIPTDWPIRRLLFTVSANAINKVTVEADGAKVFQATKAESQYVLLPYGLAASNWEFAIVFDANRKMTSELACSSLKATINTSGALTPTVLVVQRKNRYA